MALFSVLSCQKGTDVTKEACGQMTFSRITDLQLDTIRHSSFVDFFPIGDSSYVLTDGASIYKADNTGRIVKWVNNQGHGKGEYLKIGKLYSDGRNIYAWCSGSLQLYKYDLDLNFISVYSGLHHAIAKFVVSDDDTAYFLLSGGSNEVVATLTLRQNGKASFSDCYTSEDKALLFNAVSGGITIFDNQARYVKPSEMRVYSVGNGDPWTFADEDFYVSPMVEALETMPQEKVLDYLLSNSVCTGLYADDNHLWLTTETGAISQDKAGMLTYGDRSLNLYKINKSGKLVSSYMYNYPQNAVGYVIYKNCIHLLVGDGDSYKIKQCPL